MSTDRRPVGYYVHHQGRGHLARARAIRARLTRRCTLIGTMPDDATDDDSLRLPDDRIAGDFSGTDGERSRPEAFHYAPVGASDVRARMALLAAWIARERPACLIVDVSCEIALFARLLSVPVVLVRLAGFRADPPHLEAFRAADALMAPFPILLDDGDIPAWIGDKTTYLGLIGGTRSPSSGPCKPRRVTLVLGGGGTSVEAAAIVAAARATPSWEWQVLGALEAAGALPGNLAFEGWSDDVVPRLAESAIVIGGCGDGLLAEVAAYGKRFICLPENRPFDEQRSKARHLHRGGMALVRDSWPAAELWPALLDEAATIDPARLASLHDPLSADRAAALIETVIADRS